MYDLEPKIKELENIRREIKQHEGGLSESFQVQLFIEASLRKQGLLGGDKKKHTGSVLDQAEKRLEVRTLDENGNNTRSWAKSGSVSL